jgi:twinfilin-like protein
LLIPLPAFIYSCPSGSPVKSRMIYSSNALILANSAKTLLASSGAPLAARKIETADPSELTEAHLRAELGSSATKAPEASAPAPTTGFARPKGPGRKR